MPTFIERTNSIITFMPPASREFIKKCSEVVDEEAIASWLLNFGIQQVQGSLEQLEQKFLPEELDSIKAAVAELNPSLGSPPTAAAVATCTHGTRLFRSQVAALTKAELFALTFATMFDNLFDKKPEDSEYISASEFAKRHKPPHSREWASVLCKYGRIPGAIKDPQTGRWKIHVSALDKVYISEKVKSEDGKLVKEVRCKRTKKGRGPVSWRRKTQLS